jgi:hypothetical protein
MSQHCCFCTCIMHQGYKRLFVARLNTISAQNELVLYKANNLGQVSNREENNL